MLCTIGSFVFVTTLMLFAAANSESRPQRRDSEVFHTPRSDVSQVLFRRALSCHRHDTDTRARKAHLKRNLEQRALDRRAPGSGKVVTVPLEKKGALLVGEVEIGTHIYLTDPQKFNLSFDTSFPYIWVAQRGSNSGLLHDYEPHVSKSMQSTDFSFHYQEMSGNVYLDDLDIGGVKFKQTSFVCATTIPTPKLEHADGVFGLSPTHFSRRMLPFFHVAITQKEIASNIFAFHHIEDSHWELHLGGINPYLTFDRIEYHPVQLDPIGSWTIGDGRIYVNYQVMDHGFKAIFATASDLIEGDPDVVNEIYKGIYPEHKDGQYKFPCDKKPLLGFRWRHQNIWTISKNNFIYVKLDGGMCEGVLRPSLHKGGPWRFGNVFMKGKYIIFDPKKGLGIATLEFGRPGMGVLKPTAGGMTYIKMCS